MFLCFLFFSSLPFFALESRFSFFLCFFISQSLKIAHQLRCAACIRIEFDFIDQEHFHRGVFGSVTKKCEKREVCASTSKSMTLRMFHVCLRFCFEFAIQVLKQKNAHVSFPVGMVVLLKSRKGHFGG